MKGDSEGETEGDTGQHTAGESVDVGAGGEPGQLARPGGDLQSVPPRPVRAHAQAPQHLGDYLSQHRLALAFQVQRGSFSGRGLALPGADFGASFGAFLASLRR